MSRRWSLLHLSSSHSRRTAQAGVNAVDKQCFNALILPHLDAAWTYARYLTRDANVAEDVVQEAFLHAFRGQANCRGNGKAWLLTIVRNCWHDWLRAHRPQVGAAAPSEDVADEDTPHSLLERQQETMNLRTVLERLPEPFRETLVLRELEELAYRNIAEVTGVPIGTVMSRLARGREMLATLMLGGNHSDEKGAIRA